MSERLKNFIWLIVIVVAFMVFSNVRGGTSTYLDFGEDKLTVTAPENFNFSVNYDYVTNIELVNEFDPGTLVNGNETRKYRWGTWRNDVWGEYTLCSSIKIDNALVLSLANEETLVINYESEETTAALLELIDDLIENR